MWTWISCYLSGRHDYAISCEPGAVFLRCIHCGRRRSQGWTLHDDHHDASPSAAHDPKMLAVSQVDTALTAQRQ